MADSLDSPPLTLYFHPLSSFCWKVLVALYEHDVRFTPRKVELADPAERAAFLKLWPVGKFPVLRDDARDRTVPESTTIIEYLSLHYPGHATLIPKEPDAALEARHHDRFYDLYVHYPMQKIVGDRLLPQGEKDPRGVADARARIQQAYGMLEGQLAGRSWTMGDAFTLADCSASPALYYADRVVPLGDTYPNVAAYLGRLRKRPSFARVLREAEPYFRLFPA